MVKLIMELTKSPSFSMAAITAATLEYPDKSTRMVVISGVIDFRSLKHTVRVLVHTGKD
jgi:hypothetical protein